MVDAEKLPVDTMRELTYRLASACMAYTLMHVQNRGFKPWSVEMQALHVHSEVSEVYEAIRKKKSINELIHETIDVIYSGFTLLNIIGLQEYGIDGYKQYSVLMQKNIDEVVEKLTSRLANKTGPGYE